MTAEDASASGSHVSFADHAFEAASYAYRDSPDGWEHAIHAAIAALFAFLASRPAQTQACVVGACGAGSGALAHRERTIDRFTDLLRPGFAMAAAPPPPAVVAEGIGGGIYELVRSHVLERRLDELPDATSNAAIIALSPFLGADRALDEIAAVRPT